MDHSYFKDRISAFIDNELKNEEQYLIAEHLKKCEKCQLLLEQLKKFERVVEKHSGLKETDYWEKSAQKIEQAINVESAVETKVVDMKPSSWKGLRWKLAGLAASVAVIAFMALYEKDISREVQQTTKPIPLQDLSKGFEKDSIPLDEVKEKKAVIAESTRKRKLLKEETVQKQEGTNLETKPLQYTSQSAETVVDKDISVPALSDSRPKKKQLPQKKVEPEIVDEDRKITNKGRLSQKVKTDDASPQLESIATVAAESDKLMEQARDIAELSEKPVEDSLSPLTLEQWRQKRDSLMILSSEFKGYTSGKSAISEKNLAESDLVGTRQDAEKLLLECYYYIGLLTGDTEEHQTVLKYFEDYSRKENSHYKDEALRYLKQLRENETNR